VSTIQYIPPGVSVTEVTTPSISASLTSTNVCCLVGQAAGYELETQQLTLPSGVIPFNVTVLVSGETIAPVGAAQHFVSVINVINPTLGTAPTGGYLEGAGADFTAVLSSDGTYVTVTPTVEGALAAGGIVNFTYQVNNPNYYFAQQFTSQAAVEATYGPAWGATGVQTPLSAATYFAFQNGLQSVICQPLFVLSNPTNPLSSRLAPTPVQIATPSTWQQTLYALQSVAGINFVVPVIGQSMPYVNDSTQIAILETVAAYIYTMQQNGEYIQGVFGEDSSANQSYASDATLQAHAAVLASLYGGAVAENIELISPARFGTTLPTAVGNGQAIILGAEYMAASVGPMIASRAVAAPITRQAVSGWTSVPDYRDVATLNADGQAGLLVMINNAGTVIVRHAITLDSSSYDRRSTNVVRAKFHMIQTLVQAYNNQVIGQIPADGNAINAITTLTAGLLEQLVGAGELVAYTGLSVTLQAAAPTVAQVIFSWQPVYPLDYIQIQFSIDLTGAGTVTTTSTS